MLNRIEIFNKSNLARDGDALIVVRPPVGIEGHGQVSRDVVLVAQ